MKTIFITGVCGYIGSHTAVELLESGYEVIGLDNFSNSEASVLDRVEEITGKKVKLYEGNMEERSILEKIFKENKIDAVLDFAAYKAVGDSVIRPIEYYINNVSTVLTLLSAMKEYSVKTIVFSSTATVYGDPESVPVTEESKVGDTASPYATSKYFVERILKDTYISDNEWKICVFRYFNPVGAHESGLIGENPKGIPANLMPYITKVAIGELECLSVFGDDYDTKDGTGVRDYIHIVDLAKAHINALKMMENENGNYHIYNLGTGVGYSVFDIINAFEKSNGVKINYKVTERRPGDVAEYYADPTLAEKELNWKAEKTLEDMCRDAYNYIVKSNKNRE